MRLWSYGRARARNPQLAQGFSGTCERRDVKTVFLQGAYDRLSRCVTASENVRHARSSTGTLSFMQEHALSHIPFAPSVARVRAHDWTQLSEQLDAHGYVRLPGLLDGEACAALVASYEQRELFRSRVVMARHGYGRGEYQYFARPLPELVQRLREALYAPLAAVANSWMQRLGRDTRFPETHEALERACAALGQTEPTPLLLKYGLDDENRLHQDMYGQLHFPLQVVAMLSHTGRDFDGGEFVLTEQRPRTQSRVEVVPMERGDAVVFAGALRPVTGSRGDYAVKMRHGVSRIRRGERMTLGVIFHDAQ